MKIALISTYGHPLALGLRYVSAALKRRGHDVRMIFMASKRDTARARFAPPLIEALIERVRDADLVGLSLMTNTFHRARVLTEAVRSAGIHVPIIWGGVHPTLAPEECLQIADIVCLGEGEEGMIELAEALEAGRDPTSVEGFWFRSNGTIVQNPVRMLTDDLDARPFPDYDLDDQHYVAKDDALVPATPELLRGVLTRYRVQTTRGCPFQCSFCNNAALRRLYRDKGPWVRRRSNANVIAELQQRLAQFPMIEAVNVVDDLFFMRDEDDIAEFADLYAERINLPIELDAYPTTVTPRKIEILKRLPVALVSMGIQSGSEDTLFNLYGRRTPVSRIADAIDLLADARIPAEYHYIISNPFEPGANIVETLHFAARHHRPPAIVRIFPLALYPGTPLHERAVAKGIIPGRHEVAYEHTYGSRLYILHDSYLAVMLRVVLALKAMGLSARMAERFVNLVTARPVRFVLDRRWFPYAAFGVYRVGHFVARKIVYQCVLRPLVWLRRTRRHPEPAAVTA
jgi:anaerobic magnesium-protoporphyrin IX monomethyl ester cyclase